MKSQLITRKRFLFFPEIINGKFKWLCIVKEQGTYEPNGYGTYFDGSGGYLKYKFKKY